MKAQQPAEGILKVNDWGSSKLYKAVCVCTSDDCTHTIDVEAEDNDVTVTIYTTTRTNFWSLTRWQHIWTLLTKGYVDFETCIIMHKQAALNYAETLKSAIKDVESFRNDRQNKEERAKVTKEANNQDCV